MRGCVHHEPHLVLFQRIWQCQPHTMCNRPPGPGFYTRDLLHGRSESISGRLSVCVHAHRARRDEDSHGPNTETKKNQLWELQGRDARPKRAKCRENQRRLTGGTRPSVRLCCWGVSVKLASMLTLADRSDHESVTETTLVDLFSLYGFTAAACYFPMRPHEVLCWINILSRV